MKLRSILSKSKLLKIWAMGWKNQLTKTPYLVLFIVLISVGVATASALITITLSGNVAVIGDLDLTGDKIRNVGTPTTSNDAATKQYVDQAPSTDTLALLGCTTDQIAKWDGVQWICTTLKPRLNPVSIVGHAFGIGLWNSIAIGTDGNPVVSYHGQNDLMVAKCTNPTCTSIIKLSTVDDTSPNTGQYTSIAIGADGFPVISYLDATNGSLKVAKCGNASCNSGNIITTKDTGSVGSFTSIAILDDGDPVVSYYDSSNGALKFLRCSQPTCEPSNDKITTVDSGAVGTFTSIAIGVDGNPVISYHDFPNKAIKFAKCGNTTCSSGNSITTIRDHGTQEFGAGNSLAIGSDGLPIIIYYESTLGKLLATKCGDITCTSGNQLASIRSEGGDVGRYNSIAIGMGGLPVISFSDETLDALKIAKCLNPSCSRYMIEILDNGFDVDGINSIAIGFDGLPIISYQDHTGTDGGFKIITSGIVFE